MKLTNISNKNLNMTDNQSGKLSYKLSYNVQGDMIVGGKISPQQYDTKCLTVGDNNGIYLKQYQNLYEQIWNTEKSDVDTSSEYSWDKYHGKTVVLVESDTPWYINEDNKDEQNINNDVKYRNHSDYKSKIVLDHTSPNLGYGYSYADRQGISCDKIERYEGNNTDNNQIIFIILLILLLIIIWKNK